VTLRRWLERAVEEGLVRRDGGGRRDSPYRYWLPESEARWRQDPLWGMEVDTDELLRQCLAGGRGTGSSR
jgi:hypothetical protein